jgi:IclR family transcriptional regulator, pca regulon regulatory protein
MSKEAQIGVQSGRPESAAAAPRPRGNTRELPRRSRDVRIAEHADPRLSRSLEFGLALLERFSGEIPSIGIADLADMVGASRSTTHRYASTLVELGYLEQDAKRKYRLAPRAAEPGMAALGALRLSPSARFALARLRSQTGCTVGVGVRDDAHAIYIDRLPGHGVGQVAVEQGLGVGVALPLRRTAIGMALLAGVAERELAGLLENLEIERPGPRSNADRGELGSQIEHIRAVGMAESDEETASGLRSIAVLLDGLRRDRPVAIDLVAPASRCSMRELADRFGPALRRAAEQVTEIERAAGP